MKHTRLAVLLFIAFLCPRPGIGSDAGTDAVNLRLRYQVGQTYRCTMQVKKSTARSYRGTELKSTQTRETTYTCKVKAVDNKGTATIEMTIDRIVSDTSAGDHLDSSDPKTASPTFGTQVLRLMVGHTLTLRIEPSGRIVELKGMEAILEDIMRGLLPKDTDTRKATLPDTHQDLGNEANEALRVQMEAFAGVYPDKPVAVGDTWDQYTLDSRNNGVATVSFEKVIEQDQDAEPQPWSDGTLHFHLAGTRKGIVQIDEQTGLIIEGRLDLRLKGEEVFTPADDPENAVSTPLATEETTILRMEAIEAADR